MQLGLAGGLGLVLMLTACSGDSAPEVDNAEALCRQWELMDYRSAVGSPAVEEAAIALGALLPSELHDEAVLAYYPLLGPPPSNANTSGWAAAEAGDELHGFKDDVCGALPMTAFAEYFVAAEDGFSFARVEPGTEGSSANPGSGQDCFTDPGWAESSAPFEIGTFHFELPEGLVTGLVDQNQYCALRSRQRVRDGSPHLRSQRP